MLKLQVIEKKKDIENANGFTKMTQIYIFFSLISLFLTIKEI